MRLICQDFYKLWKSQAFRGRRFCVQSNGVFLNKNMLKQRCVDQGIRNVYNTALACSECRLPGRKDYGNSPLRTGDLVTSPPMDDTRAESYEVLNARGGLAIPPLSSRISILIPPRRQASRTGISRARSLRALNAGRSAKRYSAMTTSKRAPGKR